MYRYDFGTSRDFSGTLYIYIAVSVLVSQIMVKRKENVFY